MQVRLRVVVDAAPFMDRRELYNKGRLRIMQSWIVNCSARQCGGFFVQQATLLVMNSVCSPPLKLARLGRDPKSSTACTVAPRSYSRPRSAAADCPRLHGSDGWWGTGRGVRGRTRRV